MTRSGKYDLRYHAECFVGDMPRRRALLRARTIDGAKEEAERRFPLHAPGDMLRILGAVRSGSYPQNRPVTVAEYVFPKAGWAESDGAWWFRMAENEAELFDGIALSDAGKRRLSPGKLKDVADALGIGEKRVAAFVQDYGDVISEISRVELMTLADATRCLGISAFRLKYHLNKGKVGALVRFPCRRFLRRDKVEAFAEHRRREQAAILKSIRQARG
jgi:hypothetical protein